MKIGGTYFVFFPISKKKEENGKTKLHSSKFLANR